MYPDLFPDIVELTFVRNLFRLEPANRSAGKSEFYKDIVSD